MHSKKEDQQPTSSTTSGRTPDSSPSSPADFGRRITNRIGKLRSLEGFHRSSDTAFIFSRILIEKPGLYVWLCRDNRQAEAVASDLRFFLEGEANSEVLVIPGFEADPYRGLSPHPEIAEIRAVGLWRLSQGFQGFVVTTLTSFATRLPAPERFLEQCIDLEVGHPFALDELVLRLRQLGYVREDPVAGIGEYSKRGGIIDFYSPAHSNPVRVEFFGDDIESIREFNPATQRSVTLLHTAHVIPIREFSVSAEEIVDWHENAPLHWKEVHYAEDLQEKLQFTGNGELFNGFEYLFPLVVDCRNSLLDYVGTQPRRLELIAPQPEEFFKSLDELEEKWFDRFEDSCRDGELALEPSRLFRKSGEVRADFEKLKPYLVRDLNETGEQTCRFQLLPVRHYHGRIPELLSNLENWRTSGESTLFVMGSVGMAERLRDVLSEYDIPVHLSGSSFKESLGYPVCVHDGQLSQGFHAPEFGLRILTEQDVFEERMLPTRPRKPARRETPGVFISDFRDLKNGDYVVHIDHGIGRFSGLRPIGVGSNQQEFMELVYRDGAKLFVPVDRLDLVQKHSAAGSARPQLDRLGGTSWERTKRRIKKSIQKLAEELLNLYARRETATGFAFSSDDALMHEFEEAFEFEETIDQEQAIRAIKKDMETARPMDRLVCGDVGYGKTEVAMRAAFKAVNDSRQVALLAPTTVLALQHFNTFQERFQGFPVKVDMVSRFVSPKLQKEVLKRAEEGLVDILIGTHRILSKDVSFKKLGLIVVDEEQRFGVAQKERLKKLKTEVDVLSLSATPIPRTLNMSLSGVRDLSVIETPPRDRLAVQTVVVKFSQNIIRSAIDLEMKRQGQVFFVHNSVQTIHSIGAMVQKLCPEARVAVAHGQMSEKLLEKTMVDFLDYRYDVLVATTIIENGLDIPRANTLIVNRADHFGLSQLYQLRGRVGRSNRRGYAYLLVPTKEVLNENARKRLAAIREFSDLGAGFRIAAMDLEIRGAGNLLGGEQHGHINAVGLDLFLKLLEQAVRELKGEEESGEVEPSLDLRLDFQVPAHYVSDSQLRLNIYKRISSISEKEDLQRLKEEIADRHGRYPRSVSNLLDMAELRLMCRPLRIRSVERLGRRLSVQFHESTPIHPEDLVKLVNSDRRISLKPDGTLFFELETGVAPEILTKVRGLLEALGTLN